MNKDKEPLMSAERFIIDNLNKLITEQESLRIQAYAKYYTEWHKKNEKLYSEEEVIDLLYKRDLYLFNRNVDVDLILPKEWLEASTNNQ